ncbi:LysM peptidoglycan-binding domain-containing protein [Bizionia arctica]|uniref:LysM domain-containing protein n=1 Tax=Bizionia arctica TaxID=1495645 RepID=A0A917GRD4_9FLAO|nr:LysM domain-containing protein [Bizionia arctica]GGG54240.1 hypothetical protein GCM10010976_26520 [Bizionia arctica]
MKFIFNLYIFCIFGSVLGFSQSNYISHVVTSGENVYRISLKYQVSMDAIYQLNPGSDKAIIVGETLRIPDSSQSLKNSNSYMVQDNDTKWSLSKRFGMSVAEFERLNPNTVPVLIAGDLVHTSTNNNPTYVTTEREIITVNEESEVIINDSPNSNTENISEYTDYVIKSKETLYSLSTKAGMSMDEFLKLNPQLSEGFIVGSTIKMPSSNGINKNISGVASSAPKQTISTQLFWNTDLVNSSNQSEFVKNYRIGMQMAIDSIKKDIPNINISLSDSLNLTFLENADTLNSSFIIQPLVLEDNNTNYLSISSLVDGNPKSINYTGLTEEVKMRYGITKYLNKNDGNTILIYDKDKNDTKAFVEGQISNLKTIQVNSKGVFNSQDLIDLLATNTNNYIIIESERDGVFLSATNTLLKQLSNYNIELVVLNSKYIPEERKVSSKRFRILKLIYPSSFSPSFYNQKKLLLNNYTENVNLTDSNDITFGYIMVHNALSQIYFNDYENFKNYNFSTLGIPLEYDNINLQFNNNTVYIYRFDDTSDSFLLDTFKQIKL